ncbi:uncharacterized protein [Misgurnus anguillicaudatus]|uniref:uncharacterized protein n=1 Tax=Misgurnus anguillicaudatus TaxID=75329 RepID=UPI003CCFDFB9
MAFRYSSSQLRRLRSFVTTPGFNITIIKELGLLRRPRYIHRGSGRNFILHNQASCSATNIPSLWSSVACLSRHQSAAAPVTFNTGNIARPLHSSMGSPHFRLDTVYGVDSSLHGVDFKVLRGVDFNVLRPVQRFTPQSLIKFELFNTQSINNKSTLIEEHIRENGLDFMCLTETWHQPEVYSALNEACPPGYSYLEAARSTGRGGGLAVIYRQDLELSPIALPATSSCECLAFKCKPPFPMTVLLIYRPPKHNAVFFPEISDLLTTLCTTSANTIILGDINIHVDTPSCHIAADFLQLLDSLNLQQHVDVPTHSRGHTLDLVISNSAPISNLHVYDLGVSDHKVVSMELPFPSPHTKPQRQIQYRNVKKIDAVALAQDLQHLSSGFTDRHSIADSVDFYNQSLSSLLDIHAPLISRSVSFRRSAPWYNCELRKMKAAGRVLERRLKTTGLTVHKQAYREQKKAYAKALRDAQSRYYSTIINNSHGISKQLFSTINHLLKPPLSSHSETTEEMCNMHINFFRQKVNNIRSHLSTTAVLPLSTADPPFEIVQPLCSFSNATQEEVEYVIKKMKPSTCALDPFPSALLKANISAVSPFITKIINHSLLVGHIPPMLKTAVIRPLLKKPTLDPEILSNYRPISNLPFLSKVLEKIVAAQLHVHLIHNNLFEKFQSGFRAGHSTETALVRITNDLLMAADTGSPSLLILLDLTAAFDTVDHSILLHRLQYTTGLSENVHKWFISYLTGRTEYVALGKAKSHTQNVTCGVPQGSVLGPTLFSIYMLPLGRIISRHGISFHCYADDTQLYLRTTPTSSSPLPASLLTTCLEEIETWMKLNFLQLNSSKTEAILIGTPHQLRFSTINSITFSGQNITLSTSVTNLGVKMDSQLTFDTHIKHLCKTSFYHLKNIAKLRPLLNLADAEKLVHAFVSSRLDYCNALLIGISGKSIQRLQYIQNSAARILMRELLNHHTTSRTLRSANTNTLNIPRTKLCSMGGRAFSSAAPRLWNALPEHLRAPQTIDVFKKNLKTYLFKKAFY